MKRHRFVGLACVLVMPISCSSTSDIPTPPPLHPTPAPPCDPPPASFFFTASAARKRSALPLPPAEGRQLLAALESRFGSVSGEGAFTGLAPAVAAIEAASLEEVKQWPGCPMAPIQSSNDWATFKTEIRAGDFVLYFRNSDERWRVQAGVEGYAIVRTGRVVRSFVLSES